MSAIAIDWSGAKQPRGKLWLAQADQGQVHELRSLSSREDAVDRLVEILLSDPTAVGGLDFSFSFPGWFLRDLGLTTALGFWTQVERDGERWLRDCDPPFWGRPGKKKPLLESHFRRAEEQVAAVGGIRPKSCFQIGGAGAVGTGSIRGIPLLTRIRDAGVSIWPFDPPTLPLVVEIYPRMLTGAVIKSSEADRAAYVEQHWPDLSATVRVAVVGSEDAFDTAVSALVMDQHIVELRCLRGSDEIGQLEGEIWTPAAGSFKDVKG